MPVSSCTKLSDTARDTLINLVWGVLDKALNGEGLQLPPAPNINELLTPAACFVTLLHNGKLRGCIGSLEVREPLWRDACENAYQSGFNDRRFLPLTKEERSDLSLEVSVLSPLIAMDNEGESALLNTLKPGVDGLLLEDETHRAVFLPSVWSTLTTPERFVTELKRKGRWPSAYWSEDIVIHRFTTEIISSE
ncbi:AmmeMemoRadiSam system protein A [Vibrio japonicus]|uniref:AmmeMemoRadiSam system protein A n=1 Tax=Vibrio japonicus TaxID=1824638 RepID=A0ABY5LMN0_9VIBR|nr:AmmeMemoRadiSam system protein A [Vibrio japonicus]UUM32017.1 AmmeMemoRadiSam system protein A [Vibrio japonicus]